MPIVRLWRKRSVQSPFGAAGRPLVAGVPCCHGRDRLRGLVVHRRSDPRGGGAGGGDALPPILAVPVALVAGLSRAAQFGVLVKGAKPLEAMARIRTLILDKTGTLTDAARRSSASTARTAWGPTTSCGTRRHSIRRQSTPSRRRSWPRPGTGG